MTSPDYVSAFFDAVEKGDIVNASFFVEKCGVHPDVLSSKGHTALMWASQVGDYEMAGRLVWGLKATPDKRVDDNVSALMIACQWGHIRVASLLIDSVYAEINTRVTSNGMTPFMLACLGGHLEVVKLLVNQGANTKCVCKGPPESLLTGASGYDLACLRGKADVVEYLRRI